MSPNRRSLGIRAKTLLALALTLGFGIVVLVLTLRGFLLNSFLRDEEEQVRQALRERRRPGRLAARRNWRRRRPTTPRATTSGGLRPARPPGRLPESPSPAPDRQRPHRARGRPRRPAASWLGGATFDSGVPGVRAAAAGALRRTCATLAALFARRRARPEVRGIVPLGDWPLLVVSRPLPASRPSPGGRHAGARPASRARRCCSGWRPPRGAPELVFAGAGAQLPAEIRAALAVLAAGAGVFIRRPNAQIMTGYALLRDIAGKPAFLLRLQLDRTGYASGLLSLKILMVAFGLVLLATGGTYILLIESTVLRRVIRLGETVRQVGAGAAPAEGIVADGPDEIGTLTEQVRAAFVSAQRLKRELEESRQALERRVEERTRDLKDTVDALGREVEVRRAAEAQVRELEQQQRAVIDNMVGGLVTFDENLLVTRVNPAALRLLRAAPTCVGRPLAGVLPEPFAAEIAGAFRGGAARRRPPRDPRRVRRRPRAGARLRALAHPGGGGARRAGDRALPRPDRRAAAGRRAAAAEPPDDARGVFRPGRPRAAQPADGDEFDRPVPGRGERGARPGAAADHHREHRAHGGDHQADADVLPRDAARPHAGRPRRTARAPAAVPRGVPAGAGDRAVLPRGRRRPRSSRATPRSCTRRCSIC